MKLCALIFVGWLSSIFITYGQGTLLSNFGTNPGNLDGWAHIPSAMPSDAPLVVVMHGCSQNANDFSTQTAWNTLADQYKFYVVHVGQKSANNSISCFNYWEPNNHDRDKGECLSIKQMTDHMKNNYSIDPSRVFATGLSAGGAMTMVMISTYPDVFAAGASMAGLPYKTATNSTGVYISAGGFTSKSPQQWGDLVRSQYSGFTGTYPRLAVFHGTSDATININNATESIKQYTNLHNTDQTANNVTPNFQSNSNVKRSQYHNSNGQVVVEYYEISGMGHGISVDPGQGCGKGGTTGSYSLDVGLYSSYWAARFFGIIEDINTTVSQNGATLTANLPNASYQWLDCNNNFTPVSGQAGQNQSFTPQVNGEYAVAITLGQCTETSSCYTVATLGNNKNELSNPITIFPNPNNGEFSVDFGVAQNNVTLEIRDVHGRIIEQKT